MLHPVGALPPRVYWKRRLAGVGVVLLLALVPAVLLTGGEESQAGQPKPTVAGPVDTPQLDLVPAETLQPSTANPTTTPPVSGTSGTSAPPTSNPPPTTSAPPTSAAPAPMCADDVIAVNAGSTQPQWRTDAKPVFTMTVTNAGTAPCRRDVGASQQEWTLYRGETRLWGSNDCLAQPGENVHTLQPGQQVTLRVEWSGLTSEPKCEAPRERLAGGEYQLRARLGKVHSGNFTVLLR